MNTPMEPATSMLERLTHGLQLSVLLQAYSAPPLNMTSGVTTIQGSSGRPLLGAATTSPPDVRAVTFIPRNAGEGSGFFTLNLRASRAWRLAGRLQLEALAEAFNLTNHENVVTRNTNFGPRAYPSSPSPAFRQVTSVGEPRSVQLGARVRF